MRPLSFISQVVSGARASTRPDFALTPEDQAQMADLLRDLVRIPSISGQEGAVAEESKAPSLRVSIGRCRNIWAAADARFRSESAAASTTAGCYVEVLPRGR